MSAAFSLRRFVAFAAIASTVCLFGCDVPMEEADGTRVPGEGTVDGSAADGEPATSSETTDAAAPEATLTVGNGEALKKLVAERKGDVVLVDFWATWCGPCVEQFPHTVARANELADRGFSAISVSFDEPDETAAILEFLKERKAGRVTNLVSEFGMQSDEEFGVQGGMPWYVLYDRAGEQRYLFCEAPLPEVEAQVLPFDQIDAKIEELLAEPKP